MNRFHQWLHSGIFIGRIQGIPVHIHFALPLLLLYWVTVDVGSADPAQALLQSGLLFLIVFGSILLHELGHCYGAHLVGATSEGILLWPLGGLAYTSGCSRSPYDEFVVTICGPAVNLVLALISTSILWVLPNSLAETSAGFVVWRLLEYIQLINVMQFVFNMVVPLFPMDCARILRSLLAMKYDPQRVTYNICLLGIFVAGAMVSLYFVGQFQPLPIFGVTFNLFFVLIAAFGLQSCFAEMRSLEYNYVYAEPWRTNAPLRALMRRLRFMASSWRQPMPEPRTPKKPAPVKPPAGDRADFSERDQLENELRDAIRREDFVRAANRDRLRNFSAESSKG